MTSGQRVLFYIYTSGEVLFFWIFFLKDDLIFTIFFLVNFPFYFLMSHCFLIFAFILVCIYNLFFIIATPKANPPLSTKTKHQIFFLILQLYSLFTFLHLFFHLYSFCWTTKHSVITFWFSFIPIFCNPSNLSSFHAHFAIFIIHFIAGCCGVEHPLESPSAVERTHPKHSVLKKKKKMNKKMNKWT